MPANIVEGVDGRLVAAHDDDRFLADLEQEIIAPVAYAIHMAGDQPLASDHVIHIRLKYLIIAIELALQAVAKRVSAPGAQLQGNRP